MDSSKFDALTKAIATSTSRRQALRRILGILGGTALAGLVPGVALADTQIPLPPSTTTTTSSPTTTTTQGPVTTTTSTTTTTSQPGNSDCAHFCNSVFGPGPERGRCKSDAAHHTGLCYTCGPASPHGTQPICCTKNSNGTCTSYSSATCCSGGKVCTGGICV
jgi:hypothetical protein